MPLVASLVLLASTLHAGPERAVAPPVPESQPYEQILGDVAAGPEHALVVWMSGGDRNLIGIGPKTINAARVGVDGQRLDERPIELYEAMAPSSPSVARGDGTWLVSWTADAKVFARIVRDDGSVGTLVEVAPSVSNGAPYVAWNDGRYALAWGFNGALFVALLDANGHPAGGVVQLNEADRANGPTALLPDPDGGFVVLMQLGMGLDALYLSRSAVPERRESVVADTTIWSVAAAFDDETLVVSWTSDDGVYVRRGSGSVRTVAGAGTSVSDLVALGGRAFLLLQTPEGVTLRALNGGTEVTWPRGEEDNRGARMDSFGSRIIVALSVGWGRFNYFDVHTTILDSTLGVVAPQRLVYGEPRLQFIPAIARSSNGALAVWIEQREEDHRHDLIGRLLDTTGQPAGSPFTIAEDVIRYVGLGVASDGEDYLVTWMTPTIAPWSWARRMRADGSMPEPAQPIGAPAGSSCVMWNGTTFIAGYAELLAQGRGVFVTQPRFREMSADGTWGEPVNLADRIDAADVDCAAARNTSLFVWDERDGAIRGVLRTDGGAVTSPIPLGVGGNPTVASNSDNYLVAWLLPDSIERIRVSALGTVEAPLDRSIPANVEASLGGGVSLSSYGSGYYLAWGSSDVFVASLAASGERTSDPLQITDDGRHARLSGNLLVYVRDADPELGGRWRVFARTLSSALGRRSAVRR